MKPSQRSLAVRIAAASVVAVGFAIAAYTGILSRFSDPAGLKTELLARGASGYAAFILAYAVLQPFGVPGTVFIFAAPLVWPWPIAFALSMVGTMSASVVGFTFARFVARDFLAARLPTKFRKYEQALTRRAFTTVFGLRFIFWMPPLLHAFFGVSNVSFAAHFWGSLAGYAVPLLLVSYFGEAVFGIAKAAPVEVWIATAAATFVIASGVLMLRRSRSHSTRA